MKYLFAIVPVLKVFIITFFLCKYRSIAPKYIWKLDKHFHKIYAYFIYIQTYKTNCATMNIRQILF